MKKLLLIKYYTIPIVVKAIHPTFPSHLIKAKLKKVHEAGTAMLHIAAALHGQ